MQSGVIKSGGLESTLDKNQRRPHLSASTADEVVFSVGQGGDVEAEGSLLAANGTFLVSEEGITADNLSLMQDLLVEGEASFQSGLSVAGSTAVGHNLLVGSEKRKRSSDSQAVLTVIGDDTADADALLSVEVGGQRKFVIDVEGSLETAAMLLKSGGIRVESGGVRVESGGVTISQGGLMVDAGGIVSRGGLNVEGTFTTEALRAKRTKEALGAHSPLLPGERDCGLLRKCNRRVAVGRELQPQRQRALRQEGRRRGIRYQWPGLTSVCRRGLDPGPPGPLLWSRTAPCPEACPSQRLKFGPETWSLSPQIAPSCRSSTTEKRQRMCS